MEKEKIIVVRSGKQGFFKRMCALTASAAVFGAVAAGSFYGVNKLLNASDIYTPRYEVSSECVEPLNTFSNMGMYLLSAEHTSLDLDVTKIAASGLTSVVEVTNTYTVQSGGYGFFGRRQPVTRKVSSAGSGVIISRDESDLYIITNYHVVENATSLVVTFADSKEYEAEVSGSDSKADLAVLKVSGIAKKTLSNISVAKIGNSDELVVGEQVVAIGDAMGYGQSVTTGIVSALNRSIKNDSSGAVYIQTDAAINPGNSGGALLNMDGELIGINTAKIASTEIEGMGYAIPISKATSLISSSTKNGTET